MARASRSQVAVHLAARAEVQWSAAQSAAVQSAAARERSMARRKAKANLPDARELDELQFQFQQRRPAVREPARWNNLLANLLARRGYGQLATADALADAWTAAVGPELAGQTRPGRVQRGVLQVFVASSVVLQELTFRKQSLVAELVRRLPDHQIRDVRFRISALS